MVEVITLSWWPECENGRLLEEQIIVMRAGVEALRGLVRTRAA